MKHHNFTTRSMGVQPSTFVSTLKYRSVGFSTIEDRIVLPRDLIVIVREASTSRGGMVQRQRWRHFQWRAGVMSRWVCRRQYAVVCVKRGDERRRSAMEEIGLRRGGGGDLTSNLFIAIDTMASVMKMTLVPSLNKKKRQKMDQESVFEIRTNFIAVLWTDYEEEHVLIDSESFDAYMEDATDDMFLRVNTCYRLKDYWMTLSEINNFTPARPGNASLRRISVVVSFEICSSTTTPTKEKVVGIINEYSTQI
ncbi:hypothetical protein PHJA_002343300 [Phtheirospermum japonicum]|uniref:Uncharacterized protein n=1 Tax=Phtheirospermum japonicum TaxID=374723 RepID=A0A830D1F3_9LAMI|nr:hypothetical protein PHJA_002343300 [Phtheirospermum japonicum]